MKRNYICIIGIIPYGIFGIIWKSHIMFFVCLLGIIFHMNPSNNILKYIDLIINIYLSSNAMWCEKKTIVPATFSGIIYIYDNIFVSKVMNNSNSRNIKHALCIQLVGLYGYFLLYKHSPCLDFYFICNV